jgi:hypothetical protein
MSRQMLWQSFLSPQLRQDKADEEREEIRQRVREGAERQIKRARKEHGMSNMASEKQPTPGLSIRCEPPWRC